MKIYEVIMVHVYAISREYFESIVVHLPLCTCIGKYMYKHMDRCLDI